MNTESLNDKKTPWLYRAIRYLVWLFSPRFRLYGAENLPEGPCVIVGNHSHMFGPIAGELYIPGRHSVWCAAEMMERAEVPAYAFRDFWSGKPGWTHGFYRLLSHLIAPVSALIFNSAHTIPVYHDMRLVNTFRETVTQLAAGVRIVIFPETYEKHNNIVYRFQDRFIDLARFYWRKTGKALPFVPMYIAPRLKTVSFGKAIIFDPEARINEERQRICALLMDSVTELAAAQPEHVVIPYPNSIPKRRYPRNLPVEELAHETTED